MNKLIKSAALLMATVAMVFAGCNNPNNNENTGSAVKLRQITIVNGGITGTDRYTGEIDEDNLVVTFKEVAAETDLTAIKFEINASIGAELSKCDITSFRFLTG